MRWCREPVLLVASVRGPALLPVYGGLYSNASRHGPRMRPPEADGGADHGGADDDGILGVLHGCASPWVPAALPS